MGLYAGPRQRFTLIIAAGAIPTTIGFVKNVMGAKFLKVAAYGAATPSPMALTASMSHDGVNEDGGPYSGPALVLSPDLGSPIAPGGAHWLIQAYDAGSSLLTSLNCNYVKLMGLYSGSGGITTVDAWPLYLDKHSGSGLGRVAE